jgi:drug/metabolite transporter (DMT)-like permease
MMAALAGVPFMFGAMPSVSSWIALVLSGTLQIGLAFVLYVVAIRSVSAFEAILIPMIEPLLNPLWVFLVVGEKPSLWTVIGGAIVVISVTVRGLVQFSRTDSASQAEEMCYNQRPNVLS